MDDEDQISAKIVLTPAERAVLMEQIASLKVSSNWMRAAIAEGRNKELVEGWSQMSEAMNYIGTVLNMKASIALHKFIAEQQR